MTGSKQKGRASGVQVMWILDGAWGGVVGETSQPMKIHQTMDICDMFTFLYV